MVMKADRYINNHAVLRLTRMKALFSNLCIITGTITK